MMNVKQKSFLYCVTDSMMTWEYSKGKKGDEMFLALKKKSFFME